MKTIDALKEIAWQVGIEEFVDDENEQELINRMRGYINAGHEELGLDPVVIECAEDATDEQIITAINEYLKEVDKEKDLCQTCEHFWLDFPMPLDKHIAHCEVLDKKGGGLLDDVVEYPCLKCPFNSYSKKEEL